MVTVSVTRLFVGAALCVLAHFSSVFAAPAQFEGLDKKARDILARSTPAAPHWVAYWDKYTSGVNGAPSVSDLTVCLASPKSVDHFRLTSSGY